MNKKDILWLSAAIVVLAISTVASFWQTVAYLGTEVKLTDVFSTRNILVNLALIAGGIGLVAVWRYLRRR